MYWLERTTPVTIFKKSPGGPVETLAHLPLGDAGWLSATPEGDVLVADDSSLYLVSAAGEIRNLSSGLSTSRERYAIMGAWNDRAGNIYAAVYGNGQVKKITPAGEISVFATSAPSWAPTGGCSAADGSTWILEASKTNAQRVRHVTQDGKERVF
jgi:hypothetical protein